MCLRVRECSNIEPIFPRGDYILIKFNASLILKLPYDFSDLKKENKVVNLSKRSMPSGLILKYY